MKDYSTKSKAYRADLTPLLYINGWPHYDLEKSHNDWFIFWAGTKNFWFDSYTP